MVRRITYFAYNIYAPRLMDPPVPPPGGENWNGRSIASLIQLMPFRQNDLGALDDDSDFIQMSQVFDYRDDVDLSEEFMDFLEEFNALSGCSRLESSKKLAEDNDFVAAAKYPFVLRQMLRGLVGEDMGFCFELPYLIEAEDDFLVSCELAVLGHPKQAIQVLRSVLETTVAHAYFGLRGEDYGVLLASSEFRMPPFSGPKGMVQALVDAGVMPEVLQAECRKLYAQLSKSTHSHIEHLSYVLEDSAIPEDWAGLSPRVGAALIELVLRLLMRGV